jgi:hypothetical protein
MSRTRSAFLVSGILLLPLGMPADTLAVFACETVARRGDADPESAFFRNVFVERVAVNASGDVVFAAIPAQGFARVYRDEGSGPMEIVARAGESVDGEIISPARPFSTVSINDDGDLAFAARLAAGAEGVFVREDGGALEKAVATEDPAPLPGGGIFDDVRLVSAINAAAQLALLATVQGGPSGVFLYDAPTGQLTLALEEGAATLSGRKLCHLSGVALNDAAEVLVRAETKLDCDNNDGVEPPVQGLFLAHALGVETVALAGDPSPVALSEYDRFLTPQVMNAGGDVAFRADLTGADTDEHIFLWHRATATTERVVGVGEPTPIDVASSLRELRTVGLTDGGDVFVSVRVNPPSSLFGIVLYEPPFCGLSCGEAVLQRSDPPPTDGFGVGAKYNRIGHGRHEDLGIARDGSFMALTVGVVDTVLPKVKRGVIRCASPSAAFLDGEAFF